MIQHNFEKNIYRLILETITPLHIGSGNFISPNSELLNQELQIKNSAFVSNPDPFEISEFVNTNGLSFIPGSSIKGAIRSAFLSDWLQTSFGKRKLTEWLNELIDVIDNNNIKKNIKKACLIERGGRFNNGEFKGFNKLISIPCFGSQQQFDKWNNLRIPDSDNENKNNLIFELRRYFLNTVQNGIPTFAECVQTKNKFNIQLQYVKDLDISNSNIIGNKLNNIFRSKSNIKALFNNYTLAVLEYELRLLKYDDVETSHIEKYKDFLTKLKIEIEENRYKDICYFRLGAGKMQFYQTIAILIYNMQADEGFNEDNITDAWNYYKYFVNNFKEFEEFDLFPKTRALTYVNQMPLGWIRCEIK